ncbi:MAG TPA: hypothetical protein VHF25_06010 [Nitriliruptorales bacterium]|nr:hypothetical protein [Nitriliruptorales bacterium]
MADALVAIHSVLRWVVLAGLVAGGGWALLRAPIAPTFRAQPFALVAAVVDVQVLLGILLYLVKRGWTQGVFIAAIHPVVMLAALALVHVGLVGARRRHTPLDAHRAIGAAYLFALAVVAFGVPWYR